MWRDRVVVGRFVEFFTNKRPFDFDCNLYPSSLVSLCCGILDPSNRPRKSGRYPKSHKLSDIHDSS